MHIHGTADAVVPYNGYLTFKSARASVDIWTTLNGCDVTPTQVLSQGDVTCEQWSNCRDGADVQLCTVEKGGHQWPGGESIPGLGYNTDDVEASRLIWSFFKAHPRTTR